ncbi:hypothetical protein P0D71_09190 [Paraburkholderia sp. RL17-383-BIF-A]|uniref:hypothetical protein n=1 Tax=Paraburkholderia sp. RL17-383-BIF-A TaxID=3031631 RepID=UPI0038B72A25
MPVSCPSFKDAFQNNMAALNLPAPDSLFSTYTTAMTNLSAMLNALAKLGPGATVAEMIGATTGLEILAAIAGITAAAYTGAVIGSLIVAANSSSVCATSAQVAPTVSRWAASNGMRISPVMLTFLQRHPEVMIAGSPARMSYAFRNRVTTAKQRAATV